MNTGKIMHKLERWMENRSYMQKMAMGYLLCAAVPILVMMIYYFDSTTRLLRQAVDLDTETLVFT